MREIDGYQAPARLITFPFPQCVSVGRHCQSRDKVCRLFGGSLLSECTDGIREPYGWNP